MDILFSVVWYLWLGMFGVVFTFFPHRVIRLWAAFAKRFYAPHAYQPMLRMLERTPIGSVNRKLMGMPTESYIDEASRNPGVAPGMVWCVRGFGLFPLVMIALTIIMIPAVALR